LSQTVPVIYCARYAPVRSGTPRAIGACGQGTATNDQGNPTAMGILHSPALLWTAAAIQVVGLVSAWMARVSERTRQEAFFQRLFFVCLIVVGLTTIAAVWLRLACWLVSAVTFALMVLAATCDFGSRDRRGVWEW
jgi:hypothetical protein